MKKRTHNLDRKLTHQEGAETIQHCFTLGVDRIQSKDEDDCRRILVRERAIIKK